MRNNFEKEKIIRDQMADFLVEYPEPNKKLYLCEQLA
uniref:Uncharacterized protein n=1 Tax=Anguilla anguilla TaxID=7936 RepID=A0A0E9TPA8_ANGAN